MKKAVFYLVFLTIGITITYYMMQPKEKMLPVINPTDLKEEMVAPDVFKKRNGYGHTIGDFSFLDQNGKELTQKDIEEKVFVAEYFFTTCGSICPIMNKQMQRVQNAYNLEQDFEILSFTVDPEVDDVAQMKEYAIGHGANDSQWHFLTGKKEELYDLARKSFFVLKPAEAENLGDAGSDFIHTNNFVLVDKKKRIRGYYNGTSAASVDSLIHDIRHLLNE